MEPTYLRDGYTAKAFIKTVPGLHGALRFEHRPLLVEERTAWMIQAEKSGPLEADKVTARVMASRLVVWDLRDKNGASVAKSADAILGLPPRMFQKLVGIIAGSEPTDLDEESVSKSQDDLASQAEALLFPATTLQGEQQKN